MSDEASIQNEEPPGVATEKSTVVHCDIGESMRAGRTCEGIAHALAQELGTDPEELSPLYGAVECDALDEMFRSRGGDRPRADITVSFGWGRFTAILSGDGWLTIHE